MKPGMIFNLFFHYTLPQSAEGSFVWRSLHTFTSAWNKLTGSFSSFGSQPKCHLLREASVGPHNLNYILFIASPNFLLFSPTLSCLTTYFFFIFFALFITYFLFPWGWDTYLFCSLSTEGPVSGCHIISFQ